MTADDTGAKLCASGGVVGLLPVPAEAAPMTLPSSSRWMPSRFRRLDWLSLKLPWEAWRDSIRSDSDEAVRLLREPDERDDRRLRAEEESSALPDRTERRDSRSEVMVDGAPIEGSSSSSARLSSRLPRPLPPSCS